MKPGDSVTVVDTPAGNIIYATNMAPVLVLRSSSCTAEEYEATVATKLAAYEGERKRLAYAENVRRD